MASPLRSVVTLLGLCLAAGVASAADEDALALGGDPAVAEPAKQQAIRLYAEAGVGRIQQNNGSAPRDAHRAALDLRLTGKFAQNWQYTLSNRFDDIHPVLGARRSSLNSLREASVGWQNDSSSVELGRINLRNGPAYGYNPTDYFRFGALQTVTTADPIALRENRLGTYMLRASRTLPLGTMSIAIAPKLADEPSYRALSFNAGATNLTDRALLSYSGQFSQRVAAQALLLAERGRAPQWGASATALLSDALVAHGEWSVGRGASLLSSVAGLVEPDKRYQRSAIGLTYTLPTQLSLTVEYEGNGAGLNDSAWKSLLAQGPAAAQRYLSLTQSSLEVGSRQAWLVYASQKDAVFKKLDLTGFVRINGNDRSRLLWLEGRYHWKKLDLALQWQRSSGRALSEFGSAPYRQIVQLVGNWYF